MERNGKEKFLVQTNLFMYDMKHKVLPLFPESLNQLEGTLANISEEDLAKYGAGFSDVLQGCTEIPKERIKICMLNQIYELPIPLQSAKGSMDATMKCVPGNRVLNINNTRDINDSFRYIYEDNFKNYLVNEYKLNKIDTLFNLINYVLEVIPKNQHYLYGREELKVNGKGANFNSIDGVQSWNMILDDYYYLTEEKEIYTVPWKDLIGFSGEFLDFNQISPELCKIIFPISSQYREDLCSVSPKNMTKEEALEGTEESEKTFAAGVKLAYDFNPILDCRIDYSSGKVDGSFTFKYTMDINNKNPIQDGNATTTKEAKIDDFRMIIR